jgi:glycosyltransferase involved in cell wall biosynthesis
VPSTLIFTGAFTYEPNYEAMVWFLEEVFPLVRAKIPEVQLTITGKHANKPLPSLEYVTLTGFVDDIRPLVARSWVSIVPIWTGGGTRLKILEAMALHTPVVATSKGAEGLDAVIGEDLFVADTAVEFANTLITLLQDEACRQKVAQNAYEFVGQKFNWPVIAPRFLEFVERLTPN